MKRRGLRTGALLIATTVLGVGRAALAQTPESSSQAEEGGGDRGGVPGGQMVRGVITAATVDHLTVKQENGQICQVVATDNTRIMKQRQPVKLADLRAGDGVGAAGVLDASTRTMHAAVIFVVDAEQIRKAQENLGKTYVTGRITAIEDLRLTIARPDGVAQVVEVDEGTSFRKGGRGGGNLLGAAGAGGGETSSSGKGATRAGDSGESITLADVKVGDIAFATGALKGGVFHPIEFHVAPPRHRRDAGANTPQP